MLTSNDRQAQQLVPKFFKNKMHLAKGNLANVVQATLPKRSAILALAKKYPTPFYAFDTKATNQGIREFKKVFTQAIPNLEIFYAVKSNPHAYLLEAVVQNGLGLDVSSGRELKLFFLVLAKLKPN